MISAEQFGRGLGSTGSALYNNTHDPAGLALQERGLKILEKNIGAANIATVEDRASLIDSYLNNGNKQNEAIKLMQEQARLLPHTERQNGGLAAAVVQQRIDLIKQFEQVKDIGSVKQLIERSDELIKKEGKGLPLNDQGLSAQRQFLINHYMENEQFDKAAPLLEDAAKVMSGSKNPLNPAEMKLIDHLVTVGKKEKAAELLKQERGKLDVDLNKPGAMFMLSDLLKQRKELAVQLTNLGEKDSALKFAHEDVMLADKLPQQPNIEATDIEKMRTELSFVLNNLGDNKGASQLRNGTRNVLNTLENKKGADMMNIAEARMDLINTIDTLHREQEENLLKELLSDNLQTISRPGIASTTEDREKLLKMSQEIFEKLRKIEIQKL